MDQISSEDVGESPVFGAAIQGARSEQQDSFQLYKLDVDKAWLLVLADGMGGHAGGALASKLASSSFTSTFCSLRSNRAPIDECFDEALLAANKAIAVALEQDGKSNQGMGTTIVAAYLTSSSIRWISVGDSPLWLYRDGGMVRLNEDHSLRHFSPNSSQANMLQSAVVGSQITLVDRRYDPLSLYPQDLVLLSSDGLLTLDEKQIVITIEPAQAGSAELLTWLLLHAVEDKQKEHQDNCSLIVAKPSMLEVATNSKSGLQRYFFLGAGLGFFILLMLISVASWWYFRG